MKRVILVAKFLLLSSTITLAQNVSINNTGASANASAMLDVSSNTKGVLLPRMTSVGRKNIVNPAMGLLVFDSAENTLYMFDGHHWLGFGAMTDQQRTSTNFVYGPDTQDTTLAGYSVSVWDQFAAIGVPYKRIGSSYTGGVYLYKLNGAQWQYFTTLTPTGNNDASLYGCSVSIRGNYLAVGASSHKTFFGQVVGAAYIYNFNGSLWVNTQIIYGGNIGTNFGSQIAINQFGNYLAVSETDVTVAGLAGAGVVNVYNKAASTFNFQYSIQDPSPVAYSKFGSSMAMSPGGAYMMIGAPNKTVGGHAGYGYAGLYARNGTIWNEIHSLTPPLQDYLNLGASVDISDNNVVYTCGKLFEIDNFNFSGYSCVFTDNINSVAIDPATENMYAFVGNSTYQVISSSSYKIKTLGLDNTSQFPHILSAYNKNFVAGMPYGADAAKPYIGVFYFGIGQ